MLRLPGPRRLGPRFVFVLAVFVGIVSLIYREDVLGPPLAPLTMATARMTLALIHWAGMDAVREVTVISHPSGFAYEIYYRCTGFLPVAFLAVSVLAYPGRLQFKLMGLAIGVPVLLVLNLIRLVHLFYIGVQKPAFFDLAHKVIWEGLIILAVFGLWLGWAIWIDSGKTNATPSASHWLARGSSGKGARSRMPA